MKVGNFQGPNTRHRTTGNELILRVGEDNLPKGKSLSIGYSILSGLL